MSLSSAFIQVLLFLAGTVVGGLAKFFWEKYLPDRLTWQRQQEMERVRIMSGLRGPAVRAIHDLQKRIYITVHQAGQHFWYIKQQKDEDQEDYYVNSTTFLLARCYAWMEILREKMGALDYAELLTRLEKITTSFAEGYPGFQIYRLEQQEIGERMLSVQNNGDLRCMHYSEFLDCIRKKNVPKCFAGLRARVRVMLEDWARYADFLTDPGKSRLKELETSGKKIGNWAPEVVRLIRIQHALVEIVNFIDPKSRFIMSDRDELNVAEVIKRLESDDIISDHKVRSLEKEAASYAI